MVVASLVGGWLIDYGYRAPILAHTGLLVFSLYAAFKLKEPPRAERAIHTNVRDIARSLTSLLRRSHRFRYLLIYAALIQVVEIMAIVYQQPLLVSLGLPAKQLGTFYAVAILIAAGGPIALTWASAHWGIARTLGITALGVTVACFALYWLPGLLILVPLLVLRFFADGVRPVTIEGMNRLADPNDRATVLSLRGICIAGVAGPMEAISGWWADRVPLRRLYLVCGLLLPLFTLGLGRAWVRHPEPMLENEVTNEQQG
jgi:MFS family permease